MKVTGEGAVVRFIEFELVKMSALISVGGNLNNAQVQFIAQNLVEIFPHESLADFKLCFERGCIGQYGEIFRMDGIVLRKWMEKYLEEKYSEIDKQHEKQKAAERQQAQQPEEIGPGYLEFQEYAKNLAMGVKIPMLPEDLIKSEGQEKPKAKTGTGHPRITEIGLEASRIQELKREYGKLHTDLYTGKTLPGHLSFEEWKETQI